jgi:hypothetical protein
MEIVGEIVFMPWVAVNLLQLFIEVELYSAQHSHETNNNGSKITAIP